MSREGAEVMFLGGCAVDMVKFLPQFDHVVLLSAPAEVIVERLGERTNNPYGKRADELARVLHLLDTVDPRLRTAAPYDIDTSASLDDVVATLLRLVQPQR